MNILFNPTAILFRYKCSHFIQTKIVGKLVWYQTDYQNKVKENHTLVNVVTLNLLVYFHLFTVLLATITVNIIMNRPVSILFICNNQIIITVLTRAENVQQKTQVLINLCKIRSTSFSCSFRYQYFFMNNNW